MVLTTGLEHGLEDVLVPRQEYGRARQTRSEDRVKTVIGRQEAGFWHADEEVMSSIT